MTHIPLMPDPSQDLLARALQNHTHSRTVTTVHSASSSSHLFKRGPAHKHAHHLHTIPPREKSTRTLIIDHILWAHGRTRVGQARAELGMTDRTGGPAWGGGGNWRGRERPESWDEDEGVESEGEGVETLKAHMGVPRTGSDSISSSRGSSSSSSSSSSGRSDEGEGRGGGGGGYDDESIQSRQDLGLAKKLRLRAEALEKVIVSMLAQPPTEHCAEDDMLSTPPTSPKLGPSSARHKLPNGVRLRLALGTLLNDLFVRQSPAPRARQHHQQHHQRPMHSPETFPPAVLALATISAAGSAQDTSPMHRPYLTPSARTLALYDAGADPSTANSPPDLRCPRHLHTGCELCVQAKMTAVAPRSKSGTGASSIGGKSPSSGKSSSKQGGISGWKDGCGVGSGLSTPGTHGSVLRRRCGVRGEGAWGCTNLTELIPRFIRLAALVATELGMEAKESSTMTIDGEEEEDWETATLTQPTREWYLLLAGLLTRCVLEGYLTAGWRGVPVVRCLMGVGLGSSSEGGGGVSEEEDEYKEFEPDELPSLVDAVRMLFPSLRGEEKTSAEMEYEAEMDGRLRKFFGIPESTPDLSTHMEDLAWLYPAEPVERAATRFCEAMAKWRGKPELETYKKKAHEGSGGRGGMERYFQSVR